MIRPPIQRINAEYKKLKNELINDKILLESTSIQLKPWDFLHKYNAALAEYLSTAYSYENSCSIQVLKIKDKNKLDNIILNSSYIEKARAFSPKDADETSYFLSKIDKLEKYTKIWYVTFKNSSIQFGFDQQTPIVKTIISNIFYIDDLLIIRGQSTSIGNLVTQFILDFDLKDEIDKITTISNISEIFNKLKTDSELKVSTHELSTENPFDGIPAGVVTFSNPSEKEDGTFSDIEDFEEGSEYSELIQNACNIYKKLKYTYENNSFKEEAIISITKTNSALSISGKISDDAIIHFVKGIERVYNGMCKD